MTRSHTQGATEALAPSVERNINELYERRRRGARAASFQQKASAAISRFAGSMSFLYLNAIIYGAWILINAGVLPVVPPWDASLVILAMVASVEAIFLSTFILINQNRMAAIDDLRADLDLQINLLNEHETTKLIGLVEAIAKRLEVDIPADGELDELKRNVAPEAVLDRLEQMSEDDA